MDLLLSRSKLTPLAFSKRALNRCLQCQQSQLSSFVEFHSALLVWRRRGSDGGTGAHWLHKTLAQKGLESRGQSLPFRVWGLRFRVSGFRFRVSALTEYDEHHRHGNLDWAPCKAKEQSIVKNSFVRCLKGRSGAKEERALLASRRRHGTRHLFRRQVTLQNLYHKAHPCQACCTPKARCARARTRTERI